MITVLAGGTGAARFVRGLVGVVPPESIHIITNVGDDEEIWGLHISPDTDSIVYALAGLLDSTRGWGVADESFRCLETAARIGLPAWFRLGDRDLAMHVARTAALRSGTVLSEFTTSVCSRLGVGPRVLPATDDRLRTIVETPEGPLRFQEYFVRERTRVDVTGIRYEGADSATPLPAALDAIRSANTVIIAPSNPVTSIGPMLAMPALRRALAGTRAEVVAISPLIEGRAFSGPAAALLQAIGHEPSVRKLARMYIDIIDTLVIDHADAAAAPDLLRMSVRACIADIHLPDNGAAERLARTILHEDRAASRQTV